jgi:hypothetical protein
MGRAGRVTQMAVHPVVGTPAMPGTYQVPGVYREEILLAPAEVPSSGVPVFLGYAERGPVNSPRQVSLWPQFPAMFGQPVPGAYLAAAVSGFFQNAGRSCYVVGLDPAADPESALAAGLITIETLDGADLVAAPDVMRLQPDALPPDRAKVNRMQTAVLRHCDLMGDRFAILDPRPGSSVADVLDQRSGLSSPNGALYYPWIRVIGGLVPPSGHVAGVYARSDARNGVQKAPANEVLEGALDLEVGLTDAQQALLNPVGVDCLRALPGRGLRVWGARTLADDPTWQYVNVRRLVLAVVRWLERNATGVVFEPNEPRLWARLSREISAYLGDLFRHGALAGRVEQEAFYVTCDASTNPPETRDAGLVITEIGLAPAQPSEFLVVRIVHGAGGVAVGTPIPPA